MTGEQYSPLKAAIHICLKHHVGYMFWYRLYQNKKSIITRAILYHYSRKYGLEISPQSKIGPGLYLGHPYNITVGGGVSIGEHCSLHKGCTIGRENGGRGEGTPRLGNRVWVGINATVVGNIEIGSDVMICPNSFVNFDVPDHSVVIGNPGVIHHKENATLGYL